jgi:glycerophosphoryl diester phosphodiesterase
MRYQFDVPPHLQNRPRPLIIAHRGNCVQQPENSLAAFRLALAQDADALETDLRITADRKIVCHHDETATRMTGESGHIEAMTLAEVKALRLLAPDGRITGEQIPTLDELLSEFGQETFFLLELKAPQWKTFDDVTLLVATLRNHNVADRLALASFSHDILSQVRSVAPDLWTTPIMMWNPWPPARYPMVGVIWPILYINPLYVWLCHRRGQLFCPLDPTPEPRLRYYRWLGVDFVLSNNPALTRTTLAKLTR